MDCNYSQVPNKLLEGLFGIPASEFNGTKFKIALIIARYTYGFHREDGRLSISYIAKGIRTNEAQVKRELKSMIDDNFVLVTEESHNNPKKGRKMKLNESKILRYVVTGDEIVTSSELDTSTGSELVPSILVTGSRLDTTTGSGLDTQEKKKLNKESSIKERREIKKKVSDKIHYAELVTMTVEEYSKLIEEYGEETTQRAITKLDNWKGANDRKYKSDYKAILTWVIEAVTKDNKQNKTGTKLQKTIELVKQMEQKESTNIWEVG